jgi:dTDP-4-amino-4,6-dideoxygalactose transaminase
MSEEYQPVRFMDLARMHDHIRPQLDAVMKDVIDKSAFILGPEVKAFEEDFAKYIGVARGVGVDNGTSAIELILRSLGIGPGDEVIVPAMTFVATGSAVMMTGATPVFADVDPVTYCINQEDAISKVTPKTKAVIAVHLYGFAMDLKPLLDAGRNKFAVIEDTAQGHGAIFNGKRAGSFGTAAAFSFYPSKNLGAFGDGGMAVTNDQELADKVVMFRNYGERKKYEHMFLAFNKRLDSIQAAVLRVKLPHLDAWNGQRMQAAKWYREALQGTSLVLPHETEAGRHIYYVFAVRSAKRDALQAFLKERKIDSGIHFPFPLHLLPVFGYLGKKEGSFPHAEKTGREILSLPMFPGMTRDEVGRVADAVKAFDKKG